jgi:hypothetical protein
MPKGSQYPRNFLHWVDCGGGCPDSIITLEKALESTFDKMSNMHSWSEVGVIPFTQKCLTNKKVCHDGMDKDYPYFNIFQDIQSQNNFSTTQLNIMSYKGDAPKLKFTENKIWERQATATVTVLQTCKHQEAIAAAITHGKKFCIMGGKHVTIDNMFRAAEINKQTAAAVEMENGKKSRVEYHLRCESTLPILCQVNDLENNVGRKELDATPVEECPCVNKGECREQTHPVLKICRGRLGRGEYCCPVDGE